MPSHPEMIVHHLRRLTAPVVSDADLLARWIERRDESAFADLVGRHGPMVLSVCRRVLGDAQHAEDAFQATFLVLARKAASLRRQESLPAFLHGVALRLARKAQGMIRRKVSTAGAFADPADSRPDPLDALSARELLALLDEEVERLPEVYRLPLLLSVLQERSIEETAQLLGWSIGSVRGRLSRARERLRERFARRGLCLSTGWVGLLAPKVPAHLVATSVGNLTGSASHAVHALVAGSVLKLRAAWLSLLLVALTLGVSLSLLRPARPGTAVAAGPAPARAESRLDLHGDPLPTGALVRLGTLRFRAPEEIETLALAPDGKTLAVSSRGGLILLDADTGKRLRHILDWMPDQLVFSPDGKRLAGRDRIWDRGPTKCRVRIWEVGTEQKPREYPLDGLLWVGWSARNEPLAITLQPGALYLRELATGRSRSIESKELPRADLPDYAVRAATPDGRTLAIADEHRQRIHVWDMTTGKKRCTVLAKNPRIFSVAITPDGSIVLACCRNGVQGWDANTGKELYLVESRDAYRSPQFSPDGKLLAVINSWTTICFLDAATGKERGRTHDRFTFAQNFAFSSDSKTLVSAERHSTSVHLFNVATGKQKPAPVGHRSRSGGTAFYSDGRRIATGGGLDGTVHVWDLTTGKPLMNVRRPGQWVRDIALSADGRSLFSTWTDENLWVSDATTGDRQHVLKLDDPDQPDTRQSAIGMHTSADGKTLAAFSYYYAKQGGGGPSDQHMLITGWDTSTRKPLYRRTIPGRCFWLALSPDARVLAMPHSTGTAKSPKGPGHGPMHLEDVATGERLLTFPTLEGQSWPNTFSPDGRLLASNHSYYNRLNETSTQTLRLWEIASASEVLALPTAMNNRPAFSSDGQLLALTSKSGDILVYDLRRGRELKQFSGFDAQVTWLAFAADGRRLVSGLTDSTWLVWDLGERREVRAPLGARALAKTWADLASNDASRAFTARAALASSPTEAIAHCKEHLRRVEAADPGRLSQLLADLDSDQFEVRQKAQEGLKALGDRAEAALQQARKKRPSLEVVRRIELLLARLRGPIKDPETLRAVRAIAVLEDISTPAAQKVLKDLASGAEGVRITREAKAALGRLEARR